MKVVIKNRISLEEMQQDRMTMIKILVRYVDRELKEDEQFQLMEELAILNCVEIYDQAEGQCGKAYTNVGKLINMLGVQNFFSVRRKNKCVNYNRYNVLQIDSRPALLEYLAEEE